MDLGVQRSEGCGRLHPEVRLGAPWRARFRGARTRGYDAHVTAPPPSTPPPRDPVADLERIAFLLERRLEPSYRVKAFRGAARTVRALPDGELHERAGTGRLTDLTGVGPVTAGVIAEALAGELPGYLAKLEDESSAPLAIGGETLRAALRGDCHVHSDWSDGGSPIEEMALAARALGHEWMALTDHSPRLTVANGLSRERLLQQFDVVAELNERLAPFRILMGIEVDINEDGTLDQDDDLLARLDVVVGSVHSKLRAPRDVMTKRMLGAIRNPHLDILGHCTGRLVMGRGRPESEFDAEAVFAACIENGVAVEINSR
ncbi:MAG: putative hydrolase, partial [Frankiaceae bacterium]|nr:putative hydrolase [Frankiaceae bacterium]